MKARVRVTNPNPNRNPNQVGAAWGTVGAQYGAAITLVYTYARRRRARPPPIAAKAAGPFLPSRVELGAWLRFGLPLTVGQVRARVRVRV